MRHYFTCLILLLSCTYAYSQSALRGQISDVETGELMYGVIVTLESNPLKGATSDLDGNYSIEKLEAGKQKFVFRMTSYQTDTIEVDIKPNQVTVYNHILSPVGFGLKTIEIVAKANTAANTYLTAMQAKSATVLDGTTSDQMRKLGDSDASSAVKRVVGVSLVGNYVFVRGLSDRYSQILLNGAVIPSLDARKNSIQMDVFPSNALDNLMISKTFAPNLPGSFTGGLIDVRTKDFPEKFNLQYSVSVGYNPNVNLNDQFMTSGRGSSDWAGFDNGYREVSSLVTDVEKVPQINFSNFYDALVTGGYAEDLAAMGITSANQIGTQPGQMSINQIINNNPNDGITSLSQVNTLLAQDRVIKNEGLSNMGKSFRNTWNPIRERSPLNMSHNLSFGNQGKIGSKVFGYNLGVTYSRRFEYYEQGVTGRYKLTGNANDVTSLNTDQLFTDTRGDETNLLSFLGNTSLKLNDSNKIGLVLMRTQIGQNSARYQIGINPSDQVGLGQEQRTVNYNERAINIAQLKGEHIFMDLKKLRMSWIGSYTFGKQDTPDLRVFFNSFEEVGPQTIYIDANGNNITNNVLALIADGENIEEYYPGFSQQQTPPRTQYTVATNLYPAPTRYYRQMDEDLLDTRVDFELPIATGSELENKVMFGVARSAATRDLAEQRYSFIADGLPYDGNPDNYFSDVNFTVAPGGNTGYLYLREDTELQNSYSASQQIVAGYLMGDYNFNRRMRLVAGFRAEQTNMLLESRKLEDPTLNEQLRKEFIGELNKLNILPSANFNWQVSNNEGRISNIRAGFNRTIARPSFLEKAPFSTFDFETQTQLTGNPELTIVEIDNYDLRFEHFPSPGEIYSVGVFYKDFTNPIELVTNPNAPNIELTWENVERSVVYGVEFEAKKTVFEMKRHEGKVFAGANFSYIVSRTTIVEDELKQIRATDPSHKEYRPLFGQAPYIANVFFSYSDSLGWNFNIAYNLQGPKLFLVTKGGTPDIYDQPVGLLDLTASYAINKNFTVGVQARNLMDVEIKKYYEFRGQQYDWQTLRPGRLFNINLTYRI
jgi:TonB-dependent receptor